MLWWCEPAVAPPTSTLSGPREELGYRVGVAAFSAPSSVYFSVTSVCWCATHLSSGLSCRFAIVLVCRFGVLVCPVYSAGSALCACLLCCLLSAVPVWCQLVVSCVLVSCVAGLLSCWSPVLLVSVLLVSVLLGYCLMFTCLLVFTNLLSAGLLSCWSPILLVCCVLVFCLLVSSCLAGLLSTCLLLTGLLSLCCCPNLLPLQCRARMSCLSAGVCLSSI